MLLRHVTGNCVRAVSGIPLSISIVVPLTWVGSAGTGVAVGTGVGVGVGLGLGVGVGVGVGVAVTYGGAPEKSVTPSSPTHHFSVRSPEPSMDIGSNKP